MMLGKKSKGRRETRRLLLVKSQLMMVSEKIPRYQVLINKSDGIRISSTYIPEEDITIIMGYEVQRLKLQTIFPGLVYLR